MSDLIKAEQTEKVVNNCALSLRMPEELERDLESTAVAVKLSKQDTARLALERGLKILLAQLTADVAA